MDQPPKLRLVGSDSGERESERSGAGWTAAPAMLAVSDLYAAAAGETTFERALEHLAALVGARRAALVRQRGKLIELLAESAPHQPGELRTFVPLADPEFQLMVSVSALSEAEERLLALLARDAARAWRFREERGDRT